jgi:hypothetical protein
MVQMSNLPLTQWRGVKPPQKTGVLNPTAVKTPRIPDLCYMFYALDKVIYSFLTCFDYTVGKYLPIELQPLISSLQHTALPHVKITVAKGGQEIPRILLNPRIHYRVHKISPFVPVLLSVNPAHTSLSYLCKVSFNILPSTPCLQAVYHSGPTKTLYAIL